MTMTAVSERADRATLSEMVVVDADIHVDRTSPDCAPDTHYRCYHRRSLAQAPLGSCALRPPTIPDVPNHCR